MTLSSNPSVVVRAALLSAPAACLFTATIWGRFWTSAATGARGR